MGTVSTYNISHAPFTNGIASKSGPGNRRVKAPFTRMNPLGSKKVCSASKIGVQVVLGPQILNINDSGRTGAAT